MIRKILRNEIQKAADRLFGKEADFGVFWNGKFGDYSTNVALIFGGKEPKEAAEKLKKELSASEVIEKMVSEISIAGPGFLNFKLSDDCLKKYLDFSLAGKFDFGYEKTQVEFISANPTGPLTLGNGRGGVYGDVLANVLEKAGCGVMREYFINDAGNQIEVLGHSVLKDEQAEYKGEYIDEFAGKITGKNAAEVGYKASKIILENIKKTVKNIGISFDNWFSEKKELRDTGNVDEIIKWFKEKKLAYEKDEALWFKASEFGDSEDRVLVKKNGEPSYFCVDCAYHWNKFKDRKFDKVINIWGADHHGDVARVKGFAKAAGFGDKLEIILMQFVRLVENGKAARMSKRKGVFVLIDDVLREIEKDAFRFFMLLRGPDTHIDFDLELAKEQSKKNPVYYVQYAGARMSSILKKSKVSASLLRMRGEQFKIQNLNKHERNLVLKLIQFPDVIEDIANDYQVHRLTIYVHELAKTFTDFYENVRVLEAETEELKNYRLGFVAVSRQILEQILSLLGISAPEKM